MKKNTHLILFTLLTLYFTSSIGQSKIQTAKETMKGETSTHIGGNSSEDENSNTHTSIRNSYILGDLFIEFLFFSPELIAFTAYSLLIETRGEQKSPTTQATLLPYPFYDNHRGDYHIPEELLNRYIKHIHRFEPNFYYFNEKGKLRSYEGSFKWRLGGRFGIKAQHTSYVEKLINGNETLNISSLSMEYYRIRSRMVNFNWSVGLSYIQSNINNWGFLLGNELEVFIKKPISLFATTRYQTHSHDDILHIKIGTNYHNTRYKISVGYQFNNIANIKTNGIFFGAGLFL